MVFSLFNEVGMKGPRFVFVPLTQFFFVALYNGKCLHKEVKF